MFTFFVINYQFKMQLQSPESVFMAIDSAIELVESKKIDALFYKLDPDQRGIVQSSGIVSYTHYCNKTQKLRMKLDPFAAEVLRDLLTSYCQLANLKQLDRMTFHAILQSKHTRSAFPIQDILDEQEWGPLRKRVEEKRIEYSKFYKEKQKEYRIRRKTMEEKQFTLTDNLSEALLKCRDTEQFTKNLYNSIRTKDPSRAASPRKAKSREKEQQYRELQQQLRINQSSSKSLIRSRTPTLMRNLQEYY